ncbi:MAG: peptide/nickel transport system substrate-binding protein [Acidobacteriota bacterium]|nr:peptide/nickel transport system substrate-binding protein [Acidobacteriota bacterium]
MNVMKRIVVLTSIVLLAACGGGEKKKSGGGSGGANGLVIAFDGSPTNLDPRVGTDSYAGRVWDLASSGLVRITPSGEFAPDVAEKWETPDDRTIIFHLKPNAKFQDGRPITSRDFKFTFDSMMAPNFTSAKKSGYASVASFEAPDDHTFVVHLKEPNAGIFDNFPYMLVPQGADPAVFAKTPILAGAYRVTAFKSDDRVDFQAFDGWVNGPPKTKDVTVRIIPDATTRILELRRGTVNFTMNSVPYDSVEQFKKDPDFSVVASHGAAYQYIAFNLKDPILKNKQVRQALAHAIDRDRIVRDLLHGYGLVTDSMFAQGHWARAENLPKYDFNPQKAMQMLDAAGYKDPDGAGPKARFKIVYRTSTDAESNQQAEMIQQMLKQVGVDLEIRSSEFTTFMDDLTNGRFQLFSLRRNGISDPDFYYNIFHSKSVAPNGQNRGFYINPRVDQLIEEGRSTFDKTKRKAAYTEIQQILAADLPYISLYHRDNIAVMRKNVHGLVMYPSGFLLSVPEMTVDK